jgi:hypothetical protein
MSLEEETAVNERPKYLKLMKSRYLPAKQNARSRWLTENGASIQEPLALMGQTFGDKHAQHFLQDTGQVRSPGSLISKCLCSSCASSERKFTI